MNYDENNWNLLKTQLSVDFNQIHPINRAQLIDDSFNLGRSGLISSTVFLNIIEYMRNEKDPIPWTAAFNGISYVSQMLETGIDCKIWDFGIFQVDLSPMDFSSP